jgi:hypothetical protein
MRALEAEARARIKPLPMNIDGALARSWHDMWLSAAGRPLPLQSSGASPV